MMASMNEKATTGVDDALLRQCVEGLSAKVHLHRERALVRLSSLLKRAPLDEEAKSWTISAILATLRNDEGAWEAKQGALQGSKLILSLTSDAEFARAVLAASHGDLNHREYRVRMEVTEVVQELSRVIGLDVYVDLRKELLNNIAETFVRDEKKQSDASGTLDALSKKDGGDEGIGADCTVGNAAEKHTDLKHDTEGWKTLETSFKCLQALIQGVGRPVVPYIVHPDSANATTATPEDEKVIELLLQGTKHMNRFVREISYFTISSVCDIVDCAELQRIGDRVTPALALGLGDNWSQVRFSASVATRSFSLKAGEEYGSRFHALLLPRMCLNRYYVAEGVRVYSLESWKLVVGMRGKELISRYMTETCDYYVSQSEADNHAVREAACQCIAELGSKINGEAVRPHVTQLLSALTLAFKDESWPVRDSACLACGDFVLSFPEESRPSLDALYSLWFEHLSDNISSVRENAALALGKVMKAYGDEAVQLVSAKINEFLPRARDQTNDSHLHAELSNTTLFGVAAKRARDNDPTVHTDQQQFSCGSLAPKLKRGTGCMDHGFTRTREPWEFTDGAIFLLRELAAHSPDAAAKFLPTLSEVATLTHFAHYHHMLCTVWKCVPSMATSLGKKRFVRYVDELLPSLMVALRCENRLVVAAAGEALVTIRTVIGGVSLNARLTPDMKQSMEMYEAERRDDERNTDMAMMMDEGRQLRWKGAAEEPGMIHSRVREDVRLPKTIRAPSSA